MQKNKKNKKQILNGARTQRIYTTLLRGSVPDSFDPQQTYLGSGVSVGRVYTMDLNIVPIFNTVTSGTLASSRALDFTTGNIPNLSARFQSTFKEFRIIGARLVTRLLSSTGAGGAVKVYLDEKSSASPTAATAADAIGLELPLIQNPDGRTVTLDWVAHDLADLDWEDTQSPGSAPVWFKIFTNVANFGGNGAASLHTTGALRIQFRGLI